MRIAHLLVLATACTTSSSVVCEDQALCPENTICDPVTLTDGTQIDFCVDQSNFDACMGLAEGQACDTPANGSCHGGACIATACGNFLVDHDEACDDGNQKPNDGCAADCRSDETCGNGTTDIAKGETCDLGADHLGHDGCASDCATEDGVWTRLGVGRPTFRLFPMVAYDAHRRRTMLFGGGTALQLDQATFLDETFEWDGQRWYDATPAARPSARYFGATLYDAAHDEVVIFDGSTFSGDTWTWSGEQWTPRTTATHPLPRIAAMATYDSAHDRGVLFGGLIGSSEGGTNAIGDDTWFWHGDTHTWELAQPAASPSGRGFAAMAYDPKRDVIVLFGGATEAASSIAELWEFDGATWTQKTPTGGPTKRVAPVVAWDPVNQKILVAAGSSNGSSADLTDVWLWDGTTWTSVAPMPASSGFLVGVSDTVRGRVVAVGLGVVREWNGSAWSTPPEGTSLINEPTPPGRQDHVAVRDPKRREMVVYGGSTDHDATTALQDTWTWNGVWRAQAAGPAPGRWGSGMAYDVKHDSMILFGGCTASSPAPRCTAPGARSDTWQWKNHAWTQLVPNTVPPARAFPALAYDPVRERIVMFGGTSGGGAELDDTYTFDGANWHLETPTTKPPKREKAALAFDWTTGHVLMFGGRDEAADHAFADTWAWDGITWTQLTPPVSPPARVQSRLAWDASRHRLMLVGGLGAFAGLVTQSVIETWEWDGTTWAVAPADARGLDLGRYGHSLVEALDGDGLILFGGSSEAGGSVSFPEGNDVWRRDLRGTGSYETCVDVDADGDGLASCSDPDCWWACASVCPPYTTCTTPSTCGDGACDAATELCDTCAADCGACPARCGNFTCDPGESPTTCPGDCH